MARRLGQFDLGSIDLGGLSSDVPDLNVASGGGFSGSMIDTSSLLSPSDPNAWRFAGVDPNTPFDNSAYNAFAVTGAPSSTFTDPSLFSGPGDLFAQEPIYNVASGGNPSTYGGVNPPSNAGAPSSGTSYKDLQNAAALIRQLAQLGVQTYASVDQIQHGQGQGYAFSPSQLQGGQVAPYGIDPVTGQPYENPGVAPATGFSLASLTDFSTPYPYLALGGALLLVVLMTGDKKKGGRFGG